MNFPRNSAQYRYLFKQDVEGPAAVDVSKRRPGKRANPPISVPSSGVLHESRTGRGMAWMPKMIEDSGVDGPPLVRLAYEIYSDPKEASKLASWLGVLLTDLVDVARKDLTPLKNLMAIAGPYVEDKLRLNVPESKKNEVVDTLAIMAKQLSAPLQKAL